MIGRREFRRRLPYKLVIGKHTIYPMRELAYNDSISNLSRMMRRLPSTIAWWGRLKAEAVRKHKNAAQDVLERIENIKADLKAKNRNIKLNDLNLQATCDRRVRDLYRRRDFLRQKREQMEACYEAAIVTSRLIQSVGALHRSEMEHLNDSTKE